MMELEIHLGTFLDEYQVAIQTWYSSRIVPSYHNYNLIHLIILLFHEFHTQVTSTNVYNYYSQKLSLIHQQ